MEFKDVVYFRLFSDAIHFFCTVFSKLCYKYNNNIFVFNNHTRQNVE